MNQRAATGVFARGLRKAHRVSSQLLYRWLTRDNFVPIVELMAGPDRVIRKGSYEGIGCYYRTALLNVLVKLRPAICLEIGTYTGDTSRVFEYYFHKYEPRGILVTADIREYADVANDRIRQVIVYPHLADIMNYHDVTPEQLLPGSDVHIRDSGSELRNPRRRTEQGWS
jgi:hypothetical protein